MLILNPLHPLYIDKENKIIRMGNFEDNGKEIEYEDDSFLKIFENIKNPISKDNLLKQVNIETKIDINDISNAVEYLIEEKFIINYNEYSKIISDEKYSRQNLYFSMINDNFLSLDSNVVNKNILILGLGGIGSNVALMLSRAGFTNFTIVNCDNVENSNLIRQYPYDKNDIKKLKTDCLEQKIKDKNIDIKKINIKIEKESDIINEISKTDFVLCTLDKPTRIIRRLINNACIKANKPVLFSGFAEHVAMIGPFVVPKKTACLKCIEQDLTEEPFDNVKIVPSYGPLCSLISSIVCNEIINYFLKFNGNNLIGKTLMFNMATYKSEIISWKKNDDCEVC